MRYEIDRTRGEILSAMDSMERIKIETDHHYEALSSKISAIGIELDKDIRKLKKLVALTNGKHGSNLDYLQEQAELNKLRYYDLEQMFLEKSFNYVLETEAKHALSYGEPSHLMEVSA